MKRFETFTLFGWGFLGFILLAIALVFLSAIEFIPIDTLAKAILSKETGCALILSLTTAGITTAFSLVICLPVAYLLARRDFFAKSIVDTILDLPLVLPPVACGLMLLIFFSSTWGKVIPLDILFSPAGIVVAQMAVVLSLCLRTLKVAFEGVAIRQEMMARTLGLTPFFGFLKDHPSPSQARGCGCWHTHLCQGFR